MWITGIPITALQESHCVCLTQQQHHPRHRCKERWAEKINKRFPKYLCRKYRKMLMVLVHTVVSSYIISYFAVYNKCLVKEMLCMHHPCFTGQCCSGSIRLEWPFVMISLQIMTDSCVLAYRATFPYLMLVIFIGGVNRVPLCWLSLLKIYMLYWPPVVWCWVKRFLKYCVASFAISVGYRPLV